MIEHCLKQKKYLDENFSGTRVWIEKTLGLKKNGKAFWAFGKNILGLKQIL